MLLEACRSELLIASTLWGGHWILGCRGAHLWISRYQRRIADEAGKAGRLQKNVENARDQRVQVVQDLEVRGTRWASGSAPSAGFKRRSALEGFRGL